MAKDCYASCGTSLDITVAEFEKEHDKIGGFVDDDDDDVVSHASTCLHYPLASDDATAYPGEARGTAYGATPDVKHNKISGTGVCHEQRNPFRDESPYYSSQRDRTNDQTRVSDKAKLVPPPLRIRKTHEAHDGPLPESPTPQLCRRSMPPMPEATGWAPLFSGSSPKPSRPSLGSYPVIECNLPTAYPAAICTKTTTPTSSNTPTTASTTATTPQSTASRNSPTRVTTQITSLATQLTTNIDSVTTLIEKTAELQRVHRATKNHRLASFWSFTPVLQSATAADNARGSSSSTSRSSSSGSTNTNTKSTSTSTSTSTSVSGCSSRTSSSAARTSNGGAGSHASHTAVDDSKRERIERLRKEHWKTVGIRSPERGWKGAEYYERLCGVALAELYGR